MQMNLSGLRPTLLAMALACVVSPAVQAAAPVPHATATTAPAWVATSNRYARILLDAQGPFQPEQLSFLGVPGHDDQVADYGPKYPERFRAAMTRARAELLAKSAGETDPNVRQDIAILTKAADDAIQSSAVNERLVRPFDDVGQTVFSGLQGLLNDQTQPERRALALKRLQRYVGLAPGSTPLATLARQRYEERSDPKLLQPTQVEVQQSLDNRATYVSGIRQLFAKYGIDAGAATDALQQQLDAYATWTKTSVLPHARTTYSLPPELYALRLKQVGIDIDPHALIERAQFEFMELRGAMQQLAPLVARQKGIAASDYLGVIRALKQPQLQRDQIEPYYRNTVIPALERAIAEHHIVSLPNRPMQMRLASDAESAAQPAPHFLPAPLVGNTGQQGTFVLTVGNPNAKGDGAYDDFNYPSAAWTLSAHEGRPGHELQFTAMVERGVSLARTLFAFNSVNVEGWALYAEAEALPYEPIDGQLVALQLRLQRAARAMLDPMLNLGLIDRDTAFKVLTDQVGLSKGYARQEIDRYTVNSPGQAGSYFYGYSRIQQLRAETELALGDKFDRKAFNDFLLDQGLLPPDLLAKAVREQFVPREKARG
jgi:uncharacterized protein (DUF885 family)